MLNTQLPATIIVSLCENDSFLTKTCHNDNNIIDFCRNELFNSMLAFVITNR